MYHQAVLNVPRPFEVPIRILELLNVFERRRESVGHGEAVLGSDGWYSDSVDEGLEDVEGNDGVELIERVCSP